MPSTRLLSWLTILYWPLPAGARVQTWEVPVLAVCWTTEVPQAVPVFTGAEPQTAVDVGDPVGAGQGRRSSRRSPV